MANKVEILRGPFDPGGQPQTRSGNALELGFFAWNLASGMTASKAVLSDPARLRDFWHWDTALQLNQTAERIGYEYQVPFGRWRGWGGASGYNEESLDFLPAAACLAPVPPRLGLFSTAHVTYKFHPVHIAKIGATIDFVSKGRWGLNVVTGSTNRRENALFGQEVQDHDRAARYGRTVRPATMVYVIMAETDQRAQEIVDWVEAEVDKEAINNFL